MNTKKLYCSADCKLIKFIINNFSKKKKNYKFIAYIMNSKSYNFTYLQRSTGNIRGYIYFDSNFTHTIEAILLTWKGLKLIYIVCSRLIRLRIELEYFHIWYNFFGNIDNNNCRGESERKIFDYVSQVNKVDQMLCKNKI